MENILFVKLREGNDIIDLNENNVNLMEEN